MIAQRGQLLIGGQGPQVLQAPHGCVQALGGRGLNEPGEDRREGPLGEHVQNLNSERKEEERRGWDVIGRMGEVGKDVAPPEAELLQGNSLDLRELLLCQLVLEAVASEEVEADPRGHAARPTFPLQRVGPGDPCVLQALHALGGVVPVKEGKSEIHGKRK